MTTITMTHGGKFHGLIMACNMAIVGRRVVLRCAEENKAELRQRILDHNKGAWPIGLTIETMK